MTPVTFVPITALIVFVAEPAPELVIVPILSAFVVEMVIAPAAVEFSTRFPVPVMPPLKVRELATGERLRSWL